jgi:hypothetical protein
MNTETNMHLDKILTNTQFSWKKHLKLHPMWQYGMNIYAYGLYYDSLMKIKMKSPLDKIFNTIFEEYVIKGECNVAKQYEYFSLHIQPCNFLMNSEMKMTNKILDA